MPDAADELRYVADADGKALLDARGGATATKDCFTMMTNDK